MARGGDALAGEGTRQDDECNMDSLPGIVMPNTEKDDVTADISPAATRRMGTSLALPSPEDGINLDSPVVQDRLSEDEDSGDEIEQDRSVDFARIAAPFSDAVCFVLLAWLPGCALSLQLLF